MTKFVLLRGVLTNSTSEALKHRWWVLRVNLDAGGGLAGGVYMAPLWGSEKWLNNFDFGQALRSS